MVALTALLFACATTAALGQESLYLVGSGFPDTLPSSIGPSDLTASLAGLLGLPTQAASTPLGTVDVFSRPEVLLSLHLHGAEAGDVAGLLEGTGAQPIQLQSTGPRQGSADSLTAVIRAARSAGAPFELKSLDQGGLQGCGAACLEAALAEALPAVNATYARGAKGSLEGSVTWEGTPALLSLASPAARLWAVELAALYQAGTDAASEALRRRQQAGAQAEPPTLLQATLVSPAALTAHARGAGAEESAAARHASQALAGVAALVQQRLAQAYGSRLATHIALEAGRGEGMASVQRLLSQRGAHQRRRLAAVRPSIATPVSTAWLVLALAWGSGILLLLFILGGTWVMCNMPFKEDSLLYARPKVE